MKELKEEAQAEGGDGLGRVLWGQQIEKRKNGPLELIIIAHQDSSSMPSRNLRVIFLFLIVQKEGRDESTTNTSSHSSCNLFMRICTGGRDYRIIRKREILLPGTKLSI